MQNEFDFTRFIDAQAPVIDAVQRELRDGMKRTHWMWYIFPQLQGLGSSAMARSYALSSLAEAKAYLQHPLLGARLVKCTDLVNAVQGRSVNEIFGSPDDMKFHSSITLFCQADPAQPIFTAALQKYFGAVPDRRTLQLLG